MKSAAFLSLVLLSLSAIADDVHYHTDAFKDLSAFLGLQAPQTRIYRGKDSQGNPCAVSLTKTADAIVFSPLNLAGAPAPGVVPASDVAAMAFVVRRTSRVDVNGGTSGNKLWASYFYDRPGSLIHGQFGTSFNLELEQDRDGNFSTYEYSKLEAYDLASRLLGHVECRDLKRSPR